MSEILSIEELRKMASPVIEIPNFDGTGSIKVRVRKPNLVSMAAEGKVPNYLMSVAANMMGLGDDKKSKDEKEQVREVAQMMELYCQACLIEPSYEEFKEIMTEEQMEAIFNWAMGDVKELEKFRAVEGNGSSDDNGERI